CEEAKRSPLRFLGSSPQMGDRFGDEGSTAYSGTVTFGVSGCWPAAPRPASTPKPRLGRLTRGGMVIAKRGAAGRRVPSAGGHQAAARSEFSGRRTGGKAASTTTRKGIRKGTALPYLPL